ncbi:MAG: cell division topological specificity factor MinE [Zoogloeaceae bacterium]|nr:cell division topological specificity factor MinE [Zoogloeaceae bacterium]
MSLLSLLFGTKQKTASVAKERLQLIIARERSGAGNEPDFLEALQKDLIDVISKYVNINPDDIKVQLEKQGNLEVLDVNIVLPEKGRP